MYLTHPLGVPLGQVVVHGHHVNALPGQGVQVTGQRRHQGFTLTGTHFGNLAFVERDPTNHLYIEVAHAQHPLGGLAHNSKGFRQNGVQRLALGQTLLELGRFAPKCLFVQSSDGVLKRVDLLDDLTHSLQFTAVLTSEDLLGDISKHTFPAFYSSSSFDYQGLSGGRALLSSEVSSKQQHRLSSKPLPGQRSSSFAGGAPHKLLIATWDSQASIRTACDPVHWRGHICSTAPHSKPNLRA